MNRKALLVIVSLFVAFAVFFSCTSEQNSNNTPLEEPSVQVNIPLIYHMSFMSRYTKKLYFSGMAENWGLADIYSHELEEISDIIMDVGYVHDGIDVGELLKILLVPQLKLVEEAIEKRDKAQFVSSYRGLIQTCNSCHVAANYSAVRVTVPETNPFNHDFTPMSRN